MTHLKKNKPFSADGVAMLVNASLANTQVKLYNNITKLKVTLGNIFERAYN